ncbi:prolyl oligopeptidase family serine peptidase [Caulobacter sp. SSI4214]|uniref:prolyl oligopeptidase family serine peptidase n=1 Tax=Caulobacter sp. SSI4214 TaxID=2575739 RepID=UPI001438EAE6|nr:prolyl oligopeptidase family serine peptidase [Caulobacter sp. SSI4214]
MRWLPLALFALPLAQAAAPFSPARAAPAPAPVARPWTIADVAQAPEVVSLALSADGREALYVVRRGDLATNEKVSRLRLVDLETGQGRDLLKARWISDVRLQPGSQRWMLLADVGAGTQLYSLDRTGRLEPLIVSPSVDQVGGAMERLRPVGVSAYGPLSEAAGFWYEQRSAPDPEAVVVNPQFSPLLRIYGTGQLQLRLRLADGQDALVDQISAADGLFANPIWDQGSRSLTYSRLLWKEGVWSTWRWANGEKAQRTSASEIDRLYSIPLGLDGGEFVTVGYGDAMRLVEKTPDGGQVDYGPMNVVLNLYWSSGVFVAPDRKTALVGYLDRQTGRAGLLRVHRGGGVERITADGSLTGCTVDKTFTKAACILQSRERPPVLVRLDPATGQITPVDHLAPDLETISPLKSAARVWTTRDGFKASGFVVYPRDYRPGVRYPTILVTHGGDGLDRFADAAFQWQYPVQVLAERGYLVVAVNDPSRRESEAMDQAHKQWSGASGPLDKARLRDLLWLSSTHAFEDAIQSLAKEGLVDLGRVGIAGYSRGSQVTNVTMTQSKIFKAASSGDGGYLEPAGYFWVEPYKIIFGGSPYDPAAAPNYQQLSPTFRAAQAAGPILQQVADSRAPFIQLHVALREAGVPSETVVYPDESHIFAKPSNRERAMAENVAWFDFWLRDITQSAFISPEQAERWGGLKAIWEAKRAAETRQPK